MISSSNSGPPISMHIIPVQHLQHEQQLNGMWRWKLATSSNCCVECKIIRDLVFISHTHVEWENFFQGFVADLQRFLVAASRLKQKKTFAMIPTKFLKGSKSTKHRTYVSPRHLQQSRMQLHIFTQFSLFRRDRKIKIEKTLVAQQTDNRWLKAWKFFR